MAYGNIFCVGRNYRLHAAELGNPVPGQPMLFLKPTHALNSMDGGGIELPADRGAIHYETELVVRIGRTYEPGVTADDLIDGMTLGIDLTLRDVQNTLKQQGLPWLAAKGFRHSALIGRWLEYPGSSALSDCDFTLIRNGEEAQRGNVREMLFDLNEIVRYAGEYYGLDQGDLLFTGTPAGVGAVQDGDRLSVRWGNTVVGECEIILQQA